MSTMRIIVAAVALVTATTPVASQDSLGRPITLVVPFAAGGPMDAVGRILAPRMSELLRQPMIIENVGGAGGMNGSARVAKAAPDGTQIVLGNFGTHAANQTFFQNPLYNAATDFAPVALIAEVPFVLITRNNLPTENLGEFIAYAKANQSKMQYGSGGAGSSTHIACLLFNTVIGVNVTHVPYRGGGPALQDLIGGRIDYQCLDTPVAIPQIESGTVKAIAIFTRERSPSLPRLASAHEQGLVNFEASNWIGLFLPKNTSTEIVGRFHDAAVATMDTPSIKERLRTFGAVVVAQERRSPDYLQKFVVGEIEKWAAPIKASGASSP
jgi:tripartite-type tricarboxylate transporter receptor subunit TctC